MYVHARNASSLQASMSSGSCFLAEIIQMTSSSSPGGMASESMSVTKPCS